MRHIKKIILLVLLTANITIGQELKKQYVHSHNDYEQNVPFWKAYAAGANSLEADIFLEGNKLLVAHTREEVQTKRTLQALYLKPLQHAMEMGFTRDTLQLLIDIKSEPYSTLKKLVEVLENFPGIIQNPAISIVISGKRPTPAEYINYPDFISFDYQSLELIADPEVLNKISLISLNFRNFTQWNGKGRLTKEDIETVKTVVQKAHALGKPFRFWATPDSKTAWKAMADLGVDYINTDKPFECITYIHSLSGRP